MFQQIGLPQRRVEFKMKVEAGRVAAVAWGLVQREDVGKRHPPQVVEPDEDFLKNDRQIV